MLVVTYSEARKTFAAVLDRAQNEGAVIIRRADGSQFRLSPEQPDSSPFSGIYVDVHLLPGELSNALSDARRASSAKWQNR
ncbi:hypothetical protein [Spirochaeta dissipatitropha]